MKAVVHWLKVRIEKRMVRWAKLTRAGVLWPEVVFELILASTRLTFVSIYNELTTSMIE